MQSRVALLLVLVLYWAVSLPAQETARFSEQEALEFLAAEGEEPPENDQWLQEREWLKNHPLAANTVTEQELASLNILTPLQVQAFLDYRRLFGPFESRYELQAIPGWDLPLVRRLMPLFHFGLQPRWEKKPGQLLSTGQFQLLIRTAGILEKTKGLKTDSAGQSPYIGGPLRNYTRLAYQSGQQLWYGFSLEKDAGERMGDFISFHLFLKRNSWLRTIALGDYTLNIGQGLLQWQGLAFGKTGEAIAVYRQGKALQPYRSAGEYNFHRGIALETGYKHWSLIVFAAAQKRTANIVYDTDGNAVAFSSLSTAGLHRTGTELADRNTLREKGYGAVAEFRKKHFRMGLAGMIHLFDLPYQPRNEPYALFSWSGKQLRNAGIHYSYSAGNYFLFGEVAKCKEGWAFVQGAVLSLASSVDMSFVFRKLDPGYQSLYASTFSENSKASNETGLYTGLKIQLKPQWVLQGYVDLFRFPWLRYRADAPGDGFEYAAQLVHTQRRRWDIRLRYRKGEKPENETGAVVAMPVPKQQTNLRLHAERQLGKEVRLAARLEKCWFKKEGPAVSGWMAFTDGNFPLPRGRWSASLRVSYFDTQGYDTRIYAYERDLLYSFTIPAVYDRGWRYYAQVQGGTRLNIGARPLKCQWWLRWARSRYFDKTVQGSGNDEITGSHRSEWKCQLIFTW